MPWLLMFIVPISLFIAILLVFNNMNNNKEIAILKNTGLTNFRISRPALVLSIFATIFCFFVAFFLMPYFNKKLRFARVNFENNYSNISFTKGVFENLKSLTIYIKDKNENNQLFGIVLHDERNKLYSITITAKVGNLNIEDNNLLLYMKDGTLQRFNRKDFKTEILSFDDYVFNLSDNKDGAVDKRTFKPKERYFYELFNVKDASKEELAKYRSEIHQRITYPLMSFVLSLIALYSMIVPNFSRRGNFANIVFASFFAVLFLSTTITFYKIIEDKFYFIFLLYLNYFLFIAFFLGKILSKKSSK